jgi:hypothetical protein
VKVWREGQSQPVTLTDQNLKGQGGEAIVYVQNGHAFKLYRDTAKPIDVSKIAELRQIKHPRVIKPEAILRDDKGKMIGYDMVEVRDAIPLCSLFPRAFRDREGLTSKHCLALYTDLRQIVAAVHAGGCLVADPNEMNFLAAKDFSQAFAIDCDSFQTPTHRATALMPSVRDFITWPDGAKPHFSEDSDWYGFGVVSLQLWIGIHPYKGGHPLLKTLPERAKAKVSIFDPAVKMPHVVLPLDTIPASLRAWYEAVFQHGKRCAPPADPLQVVAVALRAPAPVSASLVATLLHKGGTVRDFLPGSWAVFSGEVRGIGTNKASYPLLIGPHQGALLTGTGKLARITRKAGAFEVALLEDGRKAQLGEIYADDWVIWRGRFLGRKGMQLVELDWHGDRASQRVVGQCLERATTLYRGCAIQDMLGSTMVSLFPMAGRCYQVRLKELEGQLGLRVVDAELQRNILQIVTERHSKITRWRFRFADDFMSYDLAITDISGLANTSINFACLETGIVVEGFGDDDLLVYSSKKDSATSKHITGGGTYRLAADGNRLLGAHGDQIFQLSMK